ncbi:MAG: hypothetical protein WCS42_02650 [Verrucomicrobiota bacterium]
MKAENFHGVIGMSVKGRILEKRSNLLSDFLREQGLSEPKSVEYSPLLHCERCNCFRNVEAQIKRAGGGRLETGWAFMELLDISIHTIAHGIWITPQGRRIDITPWDFGPDRRILFLPDERVAAKRGYTAGYRTVYSKDERIRAMEFFDGELDKIFDESFVGFGQYYDINGSKFREAAERFGLPWEIAKQRVDHRMSNYGH